RAPGRGRRGGTTEGPIMAAPHVLQKRFRVQGRISVERNRGARRLTLAGAPDLTAVARCDWEGCMRSVSFLAAAVLGLWALPAACGEQAAGSAAPGSSGTGAPPAAACGSATPTSPPHRTLTLSTADSGGSFCVKRGTGVLIYLRGTPT